jgi:hypothetical protein
MIQVKNSGIVEKHQYGLLPTFILLTARYSLNTRENKYEWAVQKANVTDKLFHKRKRMRQMSMVDLVR